MLNRTEASMSRTLEAILSKSDADDDLSVPPDGEKGSIGTKTLLGIGVSGLPLPPPMPARGPKIDDRDGGPQFSVEDVFDDEGTAVSSVAGNGKGKAAKGEDKQVGDLLDEVAEALNVQASESRDRAIGALPGMPVPPARAIRADVAPSSSDRDEFEFEDPDDGPTTLNAHGDDSEDVHMPSDDDEEAVVLGPAKLPGGRSLPAAPGRAAAAGALPASAKKATPFAGLPAATLPSFPAPASGRSRLPTPAPGHALGLPPPGGGRSGPPGGTPVNGVPELAATVESSRRTSAGRASSTPEKSAGHATAAMMESLTSAMESASFVLKKDVKFRVGGLVGVVLATFVVGLLIGRAVIGGGKKTTAVASETAAAADEDKGAKAVAKSEGAPSAPVAAPASAPVAAAAPPPPVAPPPPEAVAPPPAMAQADVPADLQPPPRKHRARRASLVVKDDNPIKTSPPKPAPHPAPAAAKATSKVAAPAPVAKPATKKKSTWHDPFAD